MAEIPRATFCPFCNSHDVAVLVVQRHPTVYAVRCSDCFATGPHSVNDDPLHAVNAWNERVGQRVGRLTIVK
jgi:transcription elongation factor Elf1